MFRVRIAETVTGNIVQEVSLSSNPTFTAELCQKGSWGVDIILDEVINKKADLATYATSDKYSWIIQWDDFVIQAGPPTSCSFDQNSATLKVQGSGIGAIFDQRIVRASGGLASNPSDPTGNLSYTNQTFRAIAMSLVQNSIGMSGYGLNITGPTIPEVGTSTRNYFGYSGATVWQRLTELSQVQNGLDYVFTPYLDGSTPKKLYWQLTTGNPQISLNSNSVWDYGGAMGSINVDINAAIGPVHRSYVKGSGIDADTMWGYDVNSTALAAQGYPGTDFIDTNHTDATEQTTIDAYATQNLNQYSTPVETWTVSCRLDGKNRFGSLVSPRIGEFILGESPLFRVEKHPWVAAGVYRRRILAFSSESDGTFLLKLASTPLSI